MPVVPIYLNIDDKTYQGIKSGTGMGMVEIPAELAEAV